MSPVKNFSSTQPLTSIPDGGMWKPLRNTARSPPPCLRSIIRAFSCRIECIQTDNGSGFTSHFASGRNKPTLFQVHLKQHGLRHKLIRPFTPRHNGKVERSHHKDNERFYATHSFDSFEDFARQLEVYNWRDYNNFPMRPLGWRTPEQVLRDYLRSM